MRQEEEPTSAEMVRTAQPGAVERTGRSLL